MFLNQHRLDIWIKTHTGTAFSPTSLFANSETGGWWNPADATTVFQDVAGTTPAVAGDRVRRINDKSGNGNNLLNASGSSLLSPILRTSGGLWWLEFRAASTRYLQATFTMNQPTTRISAACVVTWLSGTYLYDGGTLNTNVLGEFTGTPEIAMYAGSAIQPVDATEMTVGSNHVTTEFFSGAASTLAVDNNADNTGNPGTSNAGGATIGNGGDFAEASDLNWFGAVHIGRALTAPEIANCRTFFGNLAGLSL